jgi:hypothetical protein
LQQEHSANLPLHGHGTEEQLELYVRGQLPQAEVVELEEHLLACAACVDRLEEIVQWTQAIREALHEEAKPEPTPGWSFFHWLKSGFGIATTAVALVTLVVIGTVLFSGRARLAPVATLELAAVRGEMVTVEPARELDLRLTDAPAGTGSFRVQVVDAVGNSEWDGSVASGAAGVDVKIHKALKSGAYFVRLYGPDGEMLHEYGFRVRSRA